ncbi:cadherin-like beta sandwich domain-containing protein [Candidatus Poriferisodalis sp.]|uniref:cadherin-like beta sandwich domain-containing protein n=1 Tax=Candidatus Poriferisodalis sp. TaxID=3101277 RepID=UPI003B013B93
MRAPASSRTTVSFGHSDADIIFVGHQVNLHAGGETEISVTVASSVVPNLETACRITLTELAGTTSPLSVDASLSALSIDNIDFGSLSSETTEYSYSLGFYGALNGLLTTMTPTTAHSGATWRSNRPDAKTGIDGYQISLNGSQTVTVTVTSQDGAIRRTYTLAPTSSLRRDPTNDVHDVSFANGLWSDGEQFITTKPIDREFALYRVESPQFVEQFEMWAPREFQGWINRKLFSGAVSTWLSKESLWSDGETLWVTYLNNDDMAYAYNLTTRQRDPDRDIALTNR